MSQYSSRILIRVDYPSDWKRLYSLDLTKYNINVPAEDFFKTRKKQIELADDWPCPEDKLKKFVSEIVKTNIRCIVLADTTNFNENPFEYGVYYFGQKVKTFLIEEPDPGFDMFTTTDLTNIEEWINNSGCEITGSEKKYLAGFGIKAQVNKKSIPKESTYSIRFYLLDQDVKSELAKAKFLDTDRNLLDKLKDNPHNYYWQNIAANEAAFEVPKQTMEEIKTYIKTYSEQFTELFAVAWDGKSSNFIAWKGNKEGIIEKEIPFSKIGLTIGENIWRDAISCLEEPVDWKKEEIRKLFETDK